MQLRHHFYVHIWGHVKRPGMSIGIVEPQIIRVVGYRFRKINDVEVVFIPSNTGCICAIMQAPVPPQVPFADESGLVALTF